jgi:CO/xanthine dehydrogenase Mo-binding subunit
MAETDRIVFWNYDVFFAGSGGAQQFYNIPHHRELSHGSEYGEVRGSHLFGVGPWRAPGNNTNTFARESHIDIMAAKIGMDPLEFRLRNLNDKRMQRVLNSAAERFGWIASKSPNGKGQGVACSVDAGTYNAAMAEVEVDRNTGRVRVKRIVSAQDMGFIINPEGARMQMEGCLTMGLGYTLSEELHFKGGQILDTNFDTYEIPRFLWLPKIEAVLVKSLDLPPQGGGEPAIVCVGAVIANAIFDAIGVRLFDLPMTPERIKKAIDLTRK